MDDDAAHPDLLPMRLVRRALNTDLSIGSLEAIAVLRRDLDHLEERAVATARSRGASWADIAETLGITRQALQQRVARRALRKKAGST